MARKIYEDVNNLIEFHGTRDPQTILQERGVYVKAFSEDTKLLGMFKIILGYKYVFYNKKLDDNHLRMMFAHELGHEYYHSDDDLNAEQIFTFRNAQEVEANIFAAHLLLADQDILEYLKEGKSINEMASLECVDENLLIIKLKELMKMKIIPQMELSSNNEFFRNIDGKKAENWASEFSDDYYIDD